MDRLSDRCQVLADSAPERLLERLEDMIPNLIMAALIILVGHIVSRITLKIMARGLNVKHVDPTIHKFSMSLVRVTITVMVTVMALSALNVPMSSIIAAIGTAGLAIGLALQDSLSNVAGGFIILFSKPFKCGDYIVCGSEEGTVEMITILYTKLLTIDNRGVFIPNRTLANSTVINITGEKQRRLELRFNVSYSDDIAKVREVILETVKADSRIHDKPDEPLVAVAEHGSSAVVILLRAWVDTKDYWGVRFSLMEKVKNAFDENGITIPFDQLDIHMDRIHGDK
ncbi:MAG: mechanosensitive ion channel family protein [Ruminococcus sp.]|nr:mechanosensitive ion channel family protein [Ruminococcus sp.]